MAVAVEGRVISYWIPEAVRGTAWDEMPVYHPDSHKAPDGSWDVLVIPVPRGRMDEVRRRILDELADVPPHHESISTRGGTVANRWHVTRDDGLELGTFDDRDEAEEAAADFARDEEDFLEEWRSVFHGSHAKSQAGRIYTIRRVQG